MNPDDNSRHDRNSPGEEQRKWSPEDAQGLLASMDVIELIAWVIYGVVRGVAAVVAVIASG